MNKGSNLAFNRFVQRGIVCVEYRNRDKKATAPQKIAEHMNNGSGPFSAEDVKRRSIHCETSIDENGGMCKNQ